MSAPWTEKHRPLALDRIVHQDHAVRAAKRCIESGNMPHMLLYGPAGTGKTTLVHAMMHEFFGPRFWRARVNEFNASTDRGIKIVRERIKSIARTVIAVAPEDVKALYPCPDFQVIVLDEADALTRESQAALRRIIEDYSETTRFCILCNYPSQIIAPIVSRCARFAFSPLPQTLIIDRLTAICYAEMHQLKNANEQLSQLASDALREVAILSQGDMRAAITLLQTTVQFCQSMGEELSPEHVRLLAGKIPDELIASLIEKMTDVSLPVESLMEYLHKSVIRTGYPALDVIRELWRSLCFEAQAPESLRYAVGDAYQRAGLYVARRVSDASVLERFVLAIYNSYCRLNQKSV